MAKTQRADQGEGDGPGHGFEETAFDGLQGEDGQVRSDDDAAGEEDGALHFVGGIANFLRSVCECRRGWLRWRTMFSIITTDAVNNHAEVQRAQREQVRGNVD